MSEKKQPKTEQTESINWLDATELTVPITYLGIFGAKPVNFFFSILMSEAEKELRQKHFALPDEEQPAARHRYNVEMISKLSTRAPEGLPGFDEALEQARTGGEDFTDLQRIQAAIYAVLISETPARVKLADDTLTYYTTINQPAEFFR